MFDQRLLSRARAGRLFRRRCPSTMSGGSCCAWAARAIQVKMRASSPTRSVICLLPASHSAQDGAYGTLSRDASVPLLHNAFAGAPCPRDCRRPCRKSGCLRPELGSRKLAEGLPIGSGRPVTLTSGPRRLDHKLVVAWRVKRLRAASSTSTAKFDGPGVGTAQYRFPGSADHASAIAVAHQLGARLRGINMRSAGQRAAVWRTGRVDRNWAGDGFFTYRTQLTIARRSRRVDRDASTNGSARMLDQISATPLHGHCARRSARAVVRPRTQAVRDDLAGNDRLPCLVDQGRANSDDGARRNGDLFAPQVGSHACAT